MYCFRISLNLITKRNKKNIKIKYEKVIIYKFFERKIFKKYSNLKLRFLGHSLHLIYNIFYVWRMSIRQYVCCKLWRFVTGDISQFYILLFKHVIACAIDGLIA